MTRPSHAWQPQLAAKIDSEEEELARPGAGREVVVAAAVEADRRRSRVQGRRSAVRAALVMGLIRPGLGGGVEDTRRMSLKTASVVLRA